MIIGRAPVPAPSRHPRWAAFRRYLTEPRMSIADAMGTVTIVVAADALKISARLPWWAVLLVAWGGFALFFVATGFAKGFIRSLRAKMGSGQT